MKKTTRKYLKVMKKQPNQKKKSIEKSRNI